MKIKFLLPILIFTSLSLCAQDSVRHYSIGIAPMFGILMPHHPEIKYLVNGHIPAFEVELAFQTDGSEPWQQAFNFPSWGFSFNYYDLNSPYLGYSLATRIFYDLPLNPKRSLGLKMGIGIGYVEKPFDIDDNYHNSAIGSTWNASLALNIYGRIPLSRKWILKPGIGIHHLSNGAIKMPNAGINLGLLKVLITYDPKGFTSPVRKTPAFTKIPSSLYAGASFGMKETYPIGGKLYSVLNVFAIYDKQINYKSSFGGEIGLNYNASLEHRITDDHSASGNHGDNYRAYIAGLYQLHFDPFGIRFEMGSYIFPQFTDDGYIFFRYHILYNFDYLQLFFGLKSHFAKADNFEIGIAYKLR